MGFMKESEIIMSFRKAMIDYDKCLLWCESASSQAEYEARCKRAEIEYATIKAKYPEELKEYEADEDSYGDDWFSRYGENVL